MSKPYISAKTVAMIYKTRDVIEEIEKGAGEKFMMDLDVHYDTKQFLQSKVPYDILDFAFEWEFSPEGLNFWEDVYDKLYDMEKGAS